MPSETLFSIGFLLLGLGLGFVFGAYTSKQVIHDLRDEIQRRNIELAVMGEWQKSTIKSLVQKIGVHIPYGEEAPRTIDRSAQAIAALRRKDKHAADMSVLQKQFEDAHSIKENVNA